jgi:hypothetical protein
MTAAAPRFVRDRQALDELLANAKHVACPKCRRVGMLVGHGLLTGYGERGSGRDVRGRRLLCSARFRRWGCGRTFSVLIANIVAGFTVRTSTLSALLEGVVGGATRKATWERLQNDASELPALSLRSGYRLWDRLVAAQSSIRAALCNNLSPPPATNDERPIAQTLAHLRHVLTPAGCLLAAFQLTLQRAVFG